MQHRAAEIFHAKSAAYGCANITEAGEQGVMLRMTDKFARLRHQHIPGEAVDDALLDLMNYAAILLLLRQGNWPGYTRDVDCPDLLHALQVHERLESSLAAPQVEGDVGYDLRAAEDVTLPARLGPPMYVPTGIRIKAPEGLWTRIVGRSSTTMRGVVVAEGVIDNGYTGELFVACFNLSGQQLTIKAGERIAQLIFCPVITPRLAYVEQLPDTGRGSKGFGSTGETAGSSTAHRGNLAS
ncbi:Deoxyuridine 5'-triphosphate nucleotidohydrolase [Chondromyces apiculatus DSM 436]|uniref:dUTP diphosphatase n=1 Tax=Chondromyces apiculatus DSM 436 TaxID=1192034 RepID=A0A017TBT3_9BACT|nr:Deoxyuridine 5'-triphosphate nucleotidohydrolase [Chondromyces apiculatus DSM 436]